MALGILSFRYIYEKNIMKQHINSDNVDFLSNKKIESLSRRFKLEYWSIYKKQILRDWYKKNMTYNPTFSKKYKRIANKLQIKITDNSSIDYFDIERKIFAKSRQYKTIEVPYSFKNQKEEPAVFVFKNIKLYNSGLWLKQIFEGELYITRSEMVFYDSRTKTVYRRFKLADITKLELTNYSTKVTINKKAFNIRDVENEVIMVSIERVIDGSKVQLKRIENRDTLVEAIEKTEEALLTSEIEVNLKNKK